MDSIIQIENLSKLYRLGTVGTGTIVNDFQRWWHLARGKEDPFLKVGESNIRSKKGKSDYVWALKDINFEVKQGEVLGIIGKNGSGKSTLLKILSKVTGPTTGSISYNGRIGSLLEVGTGFHPELTGLENIFLNGAILGMTKSEIRSKLDEIIEFSGCERYINTPVKRYSSGMKVRLGFAVAAHLEPEILIVDEVLAVGDAEFQKKAIGKMQDVSGKDGRTVLFVSHNLSSVESLCERSILMENGNVTMDAPTSDVISQYLSDRKFNDQDVEVHRVSGLCNDATIQSIRLLSDSKTVAYASEIEVEGVVCRHIETPSVIYLSGTVYSIHGFPVGSFYSREPLCFDSDERCRFKLRIPSTGLVPGTYSLGLCLGYGLVETGRTNIDVVLGMPTFDIEASKPESAQFAIWNSRSMGAIIVNDVSVEVNL